MDKEFVQHDDREFRVVIADGHELYREGLKAVFSEIPWARIVGEAGSAGEMFSFMQDDAPDLVVIDPSLAGSGGASCIRRIRSMADHARIMVLTQHDNEESVYACLDAGVNAYLDKESPVREIVAAARAVLQGKTYLSSTVLSDVTRGYLENRRASNPHALLQHLTKREYEVFELVGKGRKNREIAELLFISIKTVEKHRANMMHKLRLERAVQVRRLWSDLGVR